MSYLENLKHEASYTTTLNGAKTHNGTGSACLDFFAVSGGMRYRSAEDQISLFDRAYIETPDLAMKLLFYLRDIRGGMGERSLFRNLLRHVACTWPESARKNAAYVAEFGRWDDLLCLLDTRVQKDAVRVIREQLEKDKEALERRRAGDEDAHISLLAKWLPSDNASSYRTRRLAQKLIRALGMEQREYRRTLTALRARIGLTERMLTEKHPEKVNYEAVPAGAMLKYRGVFAREDAERFDGFISEVKVGEKLIHAETLFPYEILRPFFNQSTDRDMDDDAVLDALWEYLPGAVGSTNAISVVDTSGSMYWPGRALKPALISQAMGLYCAERAKGPFRNHVITFESNPTLVEIQGETLRDKLLYLRTLPWGGSTNLAAVFYLLLRTALQYHARQEDMPEVIYIFSDMEFDRCMRSAGKTVYENAKELFERNGYAMPAVVFHNVNSWQMQVPVRANTQGCALTSGASVHSLKEKVNRNTTPLSHMLKVLGRERYAMIHA